MTLLNHILFWILACLLVWQTYILIFNKCVPNIRTAPAIRKRIIELLRADQAARSLTPYIIYDLGSGNGLITREIARALPQAQVIGIEISKMAYLWSMMMKRLGRLQNLDYRNADLTKTSVADAGAVVIFQRPFLMGLLGEKLHRELRPGTLITCNKFPLKDGWVPEQTNDVKTLYLHQKTFFQYRQK